MNVHGEQLPVTEEVKFLAVAAPRGLGTAVGRQLPASTARDKTLEIDLDAAHIHGAIGDPLPVGRYGGLIGPAGNGGDRERFSLSNHGQTHDRSGAGIVVDQALP